MELISEDGLVGVIKGNAVVEGFVDFAIDELGSTVDETLFDSLSVTGWFATDVTDVVGRSGVDVTEVSFGVEGTDGGVMGAVSGLDFPEVSGVAEEEEKSGFSLICLMMSFLSIKTQSEGYLGISLTSLFGTSSRYSLHLASNPQASHLMVSPSPCIWNSSPHDGHL